MKKYILTIGIIFVSATSFASQWGEKLNIATIDSEPRIEMEYSYSSQVYWSLRYTSTLTADKIANLPSQIGFKLVNLKTNQTFFEQTAPKEVLLSPSLIYGSDLNLFVKKFLTDQSNFALVFSDAKDQPLYFLPIADLCSQYQERIFNRTQPMNAVCVVKSSEVPPEPKACPSQQKMLVDYIEQGWLTCKSAQNIWNYIDCEKINICEQ
jgi:hypothetical protein